MRQIEENLLLLRFYNKKFKWFSQKDISKLSRIPQTHISRLENGIDLARLEDIMFYSIFFEVSTDDILFKKYNIETKKFEYPD